MSRITTTDGKRIGYLTCDLDNGEVSESFLVHISLTAEATVGDGFFFKASPTDADVLIEARHYPPGFAELWQNLASPGIDLSGDVTEFDFEIRVTAADPLSGDGLRRIVEYLAVTSNGAAQWAA